MKSSGFSLIELILVISIIGIIAGTTIPIGSSFLARNYLHNKTNELMTSLRNAQINSLAGKQNGQWGVYVGNDQIVLFQGASFASRDQVFDQSFSIPASVSISSGEIVFDINGLPNQSISFNLSTNTGDSRTVSVNQLGAVNGQ